MPLDLRKFCPLCSHEMSSKERRAFAKPWGTRCVAPCPSCGSYLRWTAVPWHTMNVAGVCLLVLALVVVLARDAMPGGVIAGLWVISLALVIVGAGMTRLIAAEAPATPRPGADARAS